jgi:hypothetical protein
MTWRGLAVRDRRKTKGFCPFRYTPCDKWANQRFAGVGAGRLCASYIFPHQYILLYNIVLHYYYSSIVVRETLSKCIVLFLLKVSAKSVICLYSLSPTT